MQLHDAVKFARMELKLSQKKFAEKAGIQRRQLATLEKGGNVTLSTVRKVLAQLPNLERFTLDTVTVDVRSDPSAPTVDAKFNEAVDLLAHAFDGLARRLRAGQPPGVENIAELRNVNVKLLSALTLEERAAALGGQADKFPELMEDLEKPEPEPGPGVPDADD